MDGGSNFGGKREKGDSEKGENRLLNGRGLKTPGFGAAKPTV